MSKLLQGLSKVQKAYQPTRLFGKQNLLGKVISYDTDANKIKVEIVGGALVGQEMDITPGRIKAEEFEEFSKVQTSSYTPIGGILRFDGVEEKNGEYVSSWTNAWIKTPGDEHKLESNKLVRYVPTNIRDKKDRPLHRIHVIDKDDEVTVASLDQMEKALTEAFEAGREAMIVDSSEGYAVSQHWLPGKKEGDTYVREDVATYVASLMETFKAAEDVVGEMMAAGHLTVVPVAVHTVGPKTSQEAEKAIAKAEAENKSPRLMGVNSFAYQKPSLGARIASAMARKDGNELVIPEVHADRFKELFLQDAPEAAKEAFIAHSWAGVDDTYLAEFLEKNGVTLLETPAATWNFASLHLQKYDKGDDFFVAKTHEQLRYGAPFPPLKCCEEIRKTYRNEVQDGILAVAKGPEADVAATKDDVKAETTKVDAEAEKAAAKAPENNAEDDMNIDEIDDLLGELADEPMG